MKIIIFSLISTLFLLSGCAKMIDGTINGIAYSTHAITGIDYPSKTGKIYIESTTLRDTKNVTPLNAQLYGFDNITAKNPMQCDSLPELTDVLTEHGWKITKNKEEADYQLYTSVVYCGYANRWLVKSNREIPMKKRLFYKGFVSRYKNISNVGVKLQKNDKHVLELFHNMYDVTKFKNYFNVFDYKYIGAPEKIKKLAEARIHIDKDGKLRTDPHLVAESIGTGASLTNYSVKGGVAMMAVGILFGLTDNHNPTYSGYKTEVTIYNPKTNKTTKKYFSSVSPMDANIYKYDMYKYNADCFASGLFYK